MGTPTIAFSLCALLCQVGDDRASAVVEKHEASFGGRAALEAAGDLYLEGTLTAGTQSALVRSWIRREPFALREELELAGQPVQVFVTDGEYAWSLDSEGKPELLRDMAAISMLDWACFTSHAYVERIESWLAEPLKLPDPFGVDGVVTGRECVGARMTTPPGTNWILGFDPEDGRLQGMIEHGPRDYRWKRFGAWKRYGPLTLPAIRVSGWRQRQTVEIFELRSVETVQRHPDVLFAGSPASEAAGPVEVLGRLEIVRASIPGSAYLLLPDVRLDDALPRTGQVDTGASLPSLQPEAAARIARPPRVFEIVRGGAGTVRLARTWLDSLDLGAERLLQFPVHIAPHPRLAELSSSMQPSVTLGGPRWVACAPVLDLPASLVLRRTRPAIPLEDLADLAVIELPYRPLGRERALGTVEVELPGGAAPLAMLLDTGFAPTLRVSARGLEEAGLPSSREAWLARGAIPIAMTGAGGLQGEDLLVRLEAFSLGPIIFEAPWVLIGLGHMQDEGDPDGLLGAGALLAFARVGLDLAEQTLELELGPAVEVLEGGRFLVRTPGEFLGLTLNAPPDQSGPARGEPEPAARDASASSHVAYARVGAVYPGTAAARAGVERGDLLVAIDGRTCEGASMDALCARLWRPAGKETTLLLRRGEHEREILLEP